MRIFSFGGHVENSSGAIHAGVQAGGGSPWAGRAADWHQGAGSGDFRSDGQNWIKAEAEEWLAAAVEKRDYGLDEVL